MDIFHTQQDQKHPPSKINSKKRLNEEQVRVLERSFTTNKKLDTELKLKLANHLGIPPRQVAIWYQNKRARWRTQSLELDYNTIQVKLENALAEKRRLEKYVKQLKEELRQAKGMLFPFTTTAAATANNNNNNNNNNNQKAVETNTTEVVVSCNYATSCSSNFSLLHEDNYVHGDDQVMQIDHELFACLIHNDGSAWGSNE